MLIDRLRDAPEYKLVAATGAKANIRYRATWVLAGGGCTSRDADRPVKGRTRGRGGGCKQVSEVVDCTAPGFLVGGYVLVHGARAGMLNDLGTQHTT
jgi:hypothetical protein